MGSVTRPARIIQEEDFIMKKTSKRVISLLLTLTLMFSAVMMFPSSVSALVKRTGVVQTDYWLVGTKNLKFSGTSYFASTGATATTKFPVTAGLTAHACAGYKINANDPQTLYYDKQTTNSGTTVSAVANPPYGIMKKAYGGHDLSYNGEYAPHLETVAG